METNNEELQDITIEAEFKENDAKKVQEKWDDYIARQESRQLSRISQVLVSTWEILGLLLKLKPGETITFDRDGNIFSGRVNLDKLKPLPQKFYVGRQSSVFDVGNSQSMPTKSSVMGGMPIWKNSWNRIHSKLLRHVTQDIPVKVSIFLVEFAEIPEDELIVESLEMKDYKFTEFTWKKFPDVTIGINPNTDLLKYYKIQGVTTWID